MQLLGSNVMMKKAPIEQRRRPRKETVEPFLSLQFVGSEEEGIIPTDDHFNVN
jgi:hypothetical protein